MKNTFISAHRDFTNNDFLVRSRPARPVARVNANSGAWARFIAWLSS